MGDGAGQEAVLHNGAMALMKSGGGEEGVEIGTGEVLEASTKVGFPLVEDVEGDGGREAWKNGGRGAAAVGGPTCLPNGGTGTGGRVEGGPLEGTEGGARRQQAPACQAFHEGEALGVHGGPVVEERVGDGAEVVDEDGVVDVVEAKGAAVVVADVEALFPNGGHPQQVFGAVDDPHLCG